MNKVLIQKTIFNKDILKPGSVIRYKNTDSYDGEGNLAIVLKCEPETLYIVECRINGQADENAITLADIDRGIKISLELEPDEFRANIF